MDDVKEGDGHSRFSDTVHHSIEKEPGIHSSSSGTFVSSPALKTGQIVDGEIVDTIDSAGDTQSKAKFVASVLETDNNTLQLADLRREFPEAKQKIDWYQECNSNMLNLLKGHLLADIHANAYQRRNQELEASLKALQTDVRDLAETKKAMQELKKSSEYTTEILNQKIESIEKKLKEESAKTAKLQMRVCSLDTENNRLKLIEAQHNKLSVKLSDLATEARNKTPSRSTRRNMKRSRRIGDMVELSQDNSRNFGSIENYLTSKSHQTISDTAKLGRQSSIEVIE